MPLDADKVRAGLAKLRQARPTIFGADCHEFLLNEPLDAEMVRSFEEQHNVQLPADYRHFLTAVGNGGAGPFHGIFALGMMDSGFGYQPWRERDGIVGQLAEPFPHKMDWNNPTGKLPDNGSDEDFDAMIESFEANYWDSSLMNGAVPICHAGCALRIWIVVTGELAGHLWYDGLANYRGIWPMKDGDGKPLAFARWYEDCLDLSLHQARLA
jgi:hypothetical protein